MYLINLHAVPTQESEYFNELVGAYVSAYIDYADAEGAIQLAKFYTEQEGWAINSIEEEYFVIESEDELETEQKEFYSEAKEYGFTMVFNGYESVSEDD